MQIKAFKKFVEFVKNTLLKNKKFKNFKKIICQNIINIIFLKCFKYQFWFIFLGLLNYQITIKNKIDISNNISSKNFKIR